MSLSWHKRKARLSSLIGAEGGEDGEALALDQLMHGQAAICKTCKSDSFYQSSCASQLRAVAKTIQIDSLRFTDKDLDLVGTLEYGQFGVVSILVQYVYVHCLPVVRVVWSMEKRNNSAIAVLSDMLVLPPFTEANITLEFSIDSQPSLDRRRDVQTRRTSVCTQIDRKEVRTKNTRGMCVLSVIDAR